MADVITVEDFRARFPEFDDPRASDAQVQAAIEDTECEFNIDRWGCAYTRGHSLLVAHLLILSERRQSSNSAAGAAPALQANSKSADSVSIGYNSKGAESSMEEYYKSTNYGQEYLMLLEQVKAPGAVVILPGCN